MHSLFSVVIFSVLCSYVLAQSPSLGASIDGDVLLNTGAGLYNVYFPGSGHIPLSGLYKLSSVVSDSRNLTFEAWIYSEKPADGKFKSIIARWPRGGVEVAGVAKYNNRYADFNFQIQKDGNLNFFMGNGKSDTYGVLLDIGVIPANTWIHVAFSILQSSSSLVPSKVSVYYQGKAFNAVPFASGGARQFEGDFEFSLGTYYNQDGDYKNYVGWLDEVRFWDSYKTLEQITSSTSSPSYPPVSLSPPVEGLIAYYRLDDGRPYQSGLSKIVQDSSGNGYNTELVGGISWDYSGAKINQLTSTQPGGKVTITLTGVTAYATSIKYAIPSNGLPKYGLLYDGTYHITPTDLPFILSGKTVTYLASATFLQSDFFLYQGSNGTNYELNPSVYFIQPSGAPCKPDACGECGGNGSSCTCLELPYKGYDILDIERILLLYEIEQTITALNQVEVQLQVVLDKLQHQGANPSVYADAINVVQTFNSDCISSFNQGIEEFIQSFAAIAP